MNPPPMYAIAGLSAVCLVIQACAPVVAPSSFDASTSGIGYAARTAPIAPIDSTQVLERFSTILQFKTVSHEDRSLTDTTAFRALHAYLEDAFPLVHSVLEREIVSGLSLLYTWRGADPTLSGVLLAAHQDVVPVAPEEEQRWTRPPFAGVVADGNIWGRGSIDNKQGMAGILEAVEHLLSEGFVPERTVYLAFGHDEEVGGTDGAARIAALLDERRAALAMVLDEGGAIFRRKLGLRKPAAIVGIAEKGSVTVELSVEMEGGHSSAPQRESAVTVLTRALDRLEKRRFPARLRGVTTLSLRYMAPALSPAKRFLLANTWLFRPVLVSALARSPETEAMIRTTGATTMIHSGHKSNVIPSTARATVNFRTLPGETAENVIEHVRRAVKDSRVNIEVSGSPRESHAVSPVEGRPFDVLRTSIEQILPDEDVVVVPYLVPGGTDARYYAPLAKAVYRFIGMRVTPGVVRGYHGLDEHIPVAEYFRSMEFYYRLLRNIQLQDAPPDLPRLLASCDALMSAHCSAPAPR